MIDRSRKLKIRQESTDSAEKKEEQSRSQEGDFNQLIVDSFESLN
jgi:hypothetical protein